MADIPKYAGCLKIGQTTQDVNVGVKQSHGQAKLAYVLEVERALRGAVVHVRHSYSATYDGDRSRS